MKENARARMYVLKENNRTGKQREMVSMNNGSSFVITRKILPLLKEVLSHSLGFHSHAGNNGNIRLSQILTSN